MALAASASDKPSVRGPKVGDAASLWNCTPSPGWTQDEVAILRLSLMKYGVGQWVKILDTGLLPGKMIQQLYGQTQRLLGQQSLAAFTSLKLDIDRVRADNEARTGVPRKAGLIIHNGPNLVREQKLELRRQSQQKYGLSEEQLAEVDATLDAWTARMDKVGGACGMTKDAMAPVVDLMSGDLEALPRGLRLQLLRRLHIRLERQVDAWRVLKGLPPRPKTTQEDAVCIEDDADGDLDLLSDPAGLAAMRAGVKDTRGRKVKAGAAKAGGKQPKRKRAGRAGPRAGGDGDGDDAVDLQGSGDDDADNDGAGRKQRRRIGQGSCEQGDAEEWDEEDEEAGRKSKGRGKAASQRPVRERRATARATTGRYYARLDGNDDVDPDAVKQLTGMGFSPRKVVEALHETGHSVEAAVEWLFAATC